MYIELVAALTEERIIGKGNDLPWQRLKGDLPHFKAITMGYPLILGRKTYESFGSKPLPERKHFILTKHPELITPCESVVVCRDLETALTQSALEREDRKVMGIGGGEIYTLLLPRSQRMHLTRVHQPYPGDTYFPSNYKDGFRLVASDPHLDLGYTFETWERV